MRPGVDVVVPFRGGDRELDGLRARLAPLALGEDDTLVVVDNTPGEARPGTLHAPEVATPGFARNRGAERGRAEWLVFLDADVAPRADLLDRYFDPPPADRTGALAGGVTDAEAPPAAPAAARFAHIRGLMAQDNTFTWGEWSFAQTSNAAFRREAFESVGGFREHIRAAEDADLTYRLRAEGWELERRECAAAVHLSRDSVRQLARQQLLHGAGGAWLDRQYPGSVPRRRWPGLLWWGLRSTTAGVARAAGRRDRDAAIRALLDPVEVFAYELGRRRSNERPRP
jgi:GT2 family glycosyltransferase